jgi:hypothetical protein
MILYSEGRYIVKKFPFTWYRVYSDSKLHAKFKYEASAVNYIAMKRMQLIEWENKK